MARKTRRAEPLDGLRGFAALGFALGSLGSVSLLAEVSFVKNLPLLADFVLLVAGFIVARAHRDQLTQSRRVGRYLFARTGRLVPLHLACLLLFVVIDIITTLSGGAGRGADASQLISNLFLVQVFTESDLVWNGPAWIIAAELYSSYLFAGLCMLGLMTVPAGRAATLAVLVGLTAARISPDYATTHGVDLAFRGVTAFLLGAMLFSFISIESVTRMMRRVKRQLGLLIEGWAIVMVFLFLIFADAGTAPLAPFVFWFCLLVFLRKPVGIAELLNTTFPQRLGSLTYAILLTHMLLIYPAAGLVSGLGTDIAAAIMTVSLPVFLLLLLGMAEIALRLIEIPTRTAMWNWADRAFPPVSPSRFTRISAVSKD